MQGHIFFQSLEQLFVIVIYKSSFSYVLSICCIQGEIMLVEISPKTPAIFYHEDVSDHSDIYQIGHVDYLRNLYRFAKVQLSMQDKRRRFCNFPRKRSCLVFLKPILYQIYEVIILCDLRNIFHGYYWFIVPDLHPSDAVYTLNPSFKSMIAKVILMV